MEMVCELCYPDAIEVGEIFPGGWLMINEGRYAVMALQGHRDDELLFFPDEPTPDSDPDCVNPDDHWVDKVLDWSETVKLSPCEGHFLVQGCTEAGWKKGDVLMWLYNRAGEMLREYKLASVAPQQPPG